MTQEELDALMAGELDLEHIEEDTKTLHDNEDKRDSHPHKDYKDSDLVAELGSVTKESEAKASEVFDRLEQVLELLDKSDSESKSYNDDIRNIIFETMSFMQYQDIHRQKIERVINTMRSISQIMNHSLESITDTPPSAKHIAGDDDTADLLNEDELEELIKKMQG